MKFPSTHDPFFTAEPQVFCVPTAGIYEVSSVVVEWQLTGKFEWVKNPSRKWFQVWKPRLIEREILEQANIHKGRSIAKLTQGEAVYSTFRPRKI